MTFRQQLLSSSNCCLLFSARGHHREHQIVVDVAQLVGPSSLFMTPSLSCRNLTASRIHLVVFSNSCIYKMEYLTVVLASCSEATYVYLFSELVVLPRNFHWTISECCLDWTTQIPRLHRPAFPSLRPVFPGRRYSLFCLGLSTRNMYIMWIRCVVLLILFKFRPIVLNRVILQLLYISSSF